ncbi:MAG: helix-turn-helix domain-containing protein [Prolixibacteraceae bacterium]|nr:helix-turn-helix domain-containing protein [Prolixibacteraceae bacterium]
MENARQAFLEANECLKSKGETPLFDVKVVGIDSPVQTCDGLYHIEADRLIGEQAETDLIIIPPLRGNLADGIRQNSAFLPWIQKQYRSGAQVASLCLGAFVLAATGLLDGKLCVTHWKSSEEFKKLFPQVKLVSDRILTDEAGIYTGGGAFSSANLVVYLIEKYADREVAIYCSKVFQVDWGRRSQTPFVIFNGQKTHDDEEIKQAQVLIEKRYRERISVNEIIEDIGIGRRTFERRFKKETGNTVMEYIQRVKVEAAKRELEKGYKTVNEVMFEVGYQDNKAFRNVFRRYSGMSPSDYRLKFVKVAMGA